MGIFGGTRKNFNIEDDVISQGKEKVQLNEITKKNKISLKKNYNNGDIKTALDEYYYDQLPIPQKYTIDTLPEKKYDYVFNSIDGAYTLGITCFSKLYVEEYDLDVCEIVHIDNRNNIITIMENVIGILDRTLLRSANKQYVETLIAKAFSPDRFEKIIIENKGHFGMVRYNKEKNKFQLCTIVSVVKKLNDIYINSMEKHDAIHIKDAIDTTNQRYFSN